MIVGWRLNPLTAFNPQHLVKFDSLFILWRELVEHTSTIRCKQSDNTVTVSGVPDVFSVTGHDAAWNHSVTNRTDGEVKVHHFFSF